MKSLTDSTRECVPLAALVGRPLRWARSSFYVVGLLVASCAAVLWFASIETYVVVRGSVRPRGAAPWIESEVSGRILQAPSEGLHVRAGEVLFRISAADVEHALERERLRLETARRELASLQRSASDRRSREVLEEEHDRIDVEVAFAEVERAQRRGDQTAARARAARVRAELTRERHETQRRLAEGGIVSQASLSESALAHDEALAVVDEEQHASDAAALEIAALEKAHRSRSHAADLRRGLRRDAAEELSRLVESSAREVKTGEQEVASLERCLASAVIRSPVDGTITWVTDRGVDEFVSAHERLAAVVSDETPWIVEGFVPDQEVGRLASEVGADARIKVDAYPYRVHGTLRGAVASLSPDTVLREDVGRAYRIEVLLPDKQLQGRSLSLGMSATVEIAAGRRRLCRLLME